MASPLLSPLPITQSHSMLSYFFKTRTFFSLIFPFLWKDKKKRIIYLFSLLLTVADFFATLFMVAAFNQVATSLYLQEKFDLLPDIGIFLAALLAKKLIKDVRKILFFPLINQSIRYLRGKWIEHLHTIPLADFHSLDKTPLLSSQKRLSLAIRSFMSIFLVDGFPEAIKMTFFLFLILKTHPLSLFFLIPMFFGSWVAYWNLKNFLSIRERAWRQTDRVFLSMKEHLEHTPTLRLKGDGGLFDHALDKEAKLWWKHNLNESMYAFSLHLFFCLATAIFSLAFFFFSPKEPLSSWILLKSYTFSLYKGLHFLAKKSRQLGALLIDLEDMFFIFSIPPEKRGTLALPNPRSIPSKKPLIEVKNIYFSFDKKNPPLLSNLSLSIYRGDWIGIMGASGSGKSLLAHLISGLYLPNKGSVELGGISTHALHPKKIGHYLSFLPQQSKPFTADRAIISPLKKSWNPAKYIGEGGEKLSSGEKQALLLEDILKKKPQILLLDESLSHLDEKSAADFIKRIKATTPTFILISHRPALMATMQKVYHLSKGGLIMKKKNKIAGQR